MNFDERHTAAGRVLFVHTAGKDRGRALEAWVMEQEPGEFASGIACDADDRGLDGRGHDSSRVLMRASTALAWRTSGQMMSTVSSPAMVPTTSGQAA